MTAQTVKPDWGEEHQTSLFDYQGELFDGETYYCRTVELPATEVEPEPTSEVSKYQLGWDRRQRGAIVEAEFDAKMVRLGASCGQPGSDPGGGIASDRYVTFAGRTITVQVRGRQLNSKGQVQFDLGPRDGDRKAGYIGRADLFALAVLDENTVITDWYLIPAGKLQRRVSLTVTPGKRSQRKRKDWLEPERYRNAWHVLLDVVSTSGHGSRSASTSRVGS